MEFVWLRSWTTAVESGDVELQEAHGGPWDRWLRHFREHTVPMVREISMLCMVSGTTKHVDPAVPRPGFGRSFHAHTSEPPRPGASWPGAPLEPYGRRSQGLG